VEINEKFVCAGAFFIAKMLVDMVHSILVCPNRDIMEVEVHHSMSIILCLLMFLPDVCFLGLPFTVMTAALEFGSAFLCFENIIRENIERWPFFCLMHDCMFRILDIFALLTITVPFYKELVFKSRDMSPLAVFVFCIPVGVIAFRQWAFIPTSKRIEMKRKTKKIDYA